MRINECPWCLEGFAGTDKQAAADRREHIDDNECGLVPRRERSPKNGGDPTDLSIEEPANNDEGEEATG